MVQNTCINALGLMSGTSLDGLDLCLSSFRLNNTSSYKILKTAEHSFPDELRTRLQNAHFLSGYELALLSNDFAKFCSEKINDFKQSDLKIDLIASHGHTVFHDPEKKLTTQIGNGAIIYAETGIKTVADFRSVDVALGGQGAPLVPIGDLLLFPTSTACLNLGGIANISYKTKDGIMAQDLCFANMALNYLCQTYLKQEYDKGGVLGKQGKVLPELLASFVRLNSTFKGLSLAREDFEKSMAPLLKAEKNKADALRTIYEYVSTIISESINSSKPNEVLVTGGGAFNSFLIELIKKKSNHAIKVPDDQTISFKEALIFGFLGTKRVLNEINCLKEVTEASADNIGGCIYG